VQAKVKASRPRPRSNNLQRMQGRQASALAALHYIPVIHPQFLSPNDSYRDSHCISVLGMCMASQAGNHRPTRASLTLVCIAMLLLGLTACGSSSSNSSSGSGSAGLTGSSGSGSGGGSGGTGGSGGSGGGGGSGSGGGSGGSGGGSSGIVKVQHVAIVVLENCNYSDIVGSANAPYINSLIAQGGVATQYYANVHPSIGNYFIMTTGEAYSTDDNFDGAVPVDNVVREFQAASKSWKVYAQSLPQQGYLGGDVYPYLRRHNPISYFSDVQPPSQLNMNIVNFSQLAIDLPAGQLPAYSFIVPDAEHDAHDCPGGGSDCDVGTRVAAADAWLSANLPQLLTNSQFQQSGLLVLTTDESRNDNNHGGGRVATVLVGTGVKVGYQGTVLYDHRSLLGLSMKALGLTTIPNGAGNAPQMTEFFQ
jgi:phosphatidylinositol-3-phosphatase